MTKLSKAVHIGLLFIMVPVVSACQSTYNESTGRDIFIIPGGYVGRVIIFYGQPDGQVEKTVSGNNIFIVPQSGILRTQASINYEWSELPLYYYDSISVNTEIPTRTDWELYSDDDPNASLVSTGSLELQQNHTSVSFGEFFIGTKRQIRQAAELADGNPVRSLFH